MSPRVIDSVRCPQESQMYSNMGITHSASLWPADGHGGTSCRFYGEPWGRCCLPIMGAPIYNESCEHEPLQPQQGYGGRYLSEFEGTDEPDCSTRGGDKNHRQGKSGRR